LRKPFAAGGITGVWIRIRGWFKTVAFKDGKLRRCGICYFQDEEALSSGFTEQRFWSGELSLRNLQLNSSERPSREFRWRLTSLLNASWGQLLQRGIGIRCSECILRNRHSCSHCLGHESNREARTGRADNCGGQFSLVHPTLTCLRQTVATEERKTKPAVPLRRRYPLPDGSSRAHSHGIVLGRDQPNGKLL